MAKIHEVTHFLESIAPLELQEKYDNAGLITGHWDWEISGVLCALDATPEVIDEAIALQKNLVVVHHPIIFSGLKQINGKNYIEKAIITAIKSDIAIYAIHTNLDNVLTHGVNERLAQQLNLTKLQILQPKNSAEQHIGSGILGQLSEKVSIQQFLSQVKADLDLSVIKHTRFTDTDEVLKVAACGGSGSFLLPQAIAAGADVFITADFKYHQYFDANDEIVIFDIGHYESEKFTINLLNELINNNFRNFASHCTNHNTNPVYYYF